MIPQGKYRIMAFKEFVPDRLRFIILLCTAIVFQLSNSVYLTNLNEVVGGKALTVEDVKLIFSASFIGMTMVFPLLFRIKFRFLSRTILLTAAAVVVIGNIISLYSNNVLLLIVVSFLVGTFRMIGMFECMSSIQLVITPTRDFTVFFSIVYLIVLGSVQASGLLTAEISHLYSWKYMHILIVGLLLTVMTVIYFLMRPIRLMRKFPLYQIDWLGWGLWTLVLFLFNFVFEYGERLDWFDSRYICLATLAGCFLLACAIQRMFGIRRPFLMPELFRYKPLLKAMLLLAFLQVFLSTSNVILNVYTGAILHYDTLHSASLNWMVFGGVVVGAGLSYYWMSIYRGSYKTIFFVGFLCFVVEHFMLYFLFQPGLAKEQLYIPYILKGMGYISLYISLALYAAEGVAFPHFFASLTLISFVRSSLIDTMANSFCNHAVQYLQKKNLMILSQEMDLVNGLSSHIYGGKIQEALAAGHTMEEARVAATSTLYGITRMQAMLVSWKEIFGVITLLGILLLLGIAATPYIKPSIRQFPKIKNIWKYTWGKATATR